MGIQLTKTSLDAGYVRACADSVQDNHMDDQAHHLFLHSVPPDNPIDPGPLPMTSHLTSALARLAATGMDNNHEVLPPSVASMVEKFQHGVPRRFQHLLVMLVQKQHFIHVQHLSAQNPSWAARLRSASAPGAHHWLTTLPTSRDLTMMDAHSKIAVRLLLGLPPHPTGANQQPPPCFFCRRPMRSDPWHPLHCLFQASHGKSDQHNQIRDKLHEFCEKAGLGNARIEPRDYLSVCAVRPDLSVCFDSGVHTVDVSGTDPCAPSLVAAAARRTLSAASAREQTKITQYGPMVAAFGVQFSPFVFETHGGLGDKAMEFVDKLSLHAAARPGASSRGNFRFHLLSSLSVII